MTQPMPMPPPEKPTESAAPRTKSKGEKLFDRTVYAGIAGVGTFVATVFLTHSLKYGSLKRLHEGAVNVVEKFLNNVAPRRGAIKNNELAETGVMTTNLMMGGNLMLIPVGIAEHHKVALVDGLNAATDDPTPKEQIQHTTKQNWISLLESRAVAWLAVFATFKTLGAYYEETMKSFERQTGELLCRITGKPAYHASQETVDALTSEALKLKTENASKELLKQNAAELEALESKMFRYGKIGALDVFATIGAATLLYIGGHFFARKQEEKKELREERKLEAKIVRAEYPELHDVAAAKAEMPASRVSGDKQHERMVTTPELAQQL